MFDLKLVAVLAVSLSASAAHALTTVTVEAAGVQATTIRGIMGIETFDNVTRYTSPFRTNFGGSGFTGTFSDILPSKANPYGGAGGTGRYATVQRITTLNVAGPQINYFGLWGSALDGGNSVAFYNAGALVDTISLVAQPLGTSYFGNPNAAYLNQNRTEKYAFFNFVVAGGYDKVLLIQNNGGGFELDNVTVGTAIVPEPASWAMLIAGFGLVGAAMRRLRAIAA